MKLVAIAIPLKLLAFWFRSKITYIPTDTSLAIKMPFYQLTIFYEDIRSASLLKNSFDDFKFGKSLRVFKLGAGEIIRFEKQTGLLRFVYIKPETADEIVFKLADYARGRGRTISDVVNGKKQTRHLHFIEPVV